MSVLISVIVPVYNVEQYLEKCVKTILAQTYTNFELLLVDDGSVDSSGKLCDAFAQEDTRVRVIHKKNGGVSSARNAALDIMQGDCVLFVDSDDYIHPQMLEVLVDLMERHDAGISMCFSRGTKVRDYAEPDQPSYTEKCVSAVRAMEILYSSFSFSFFGYNPTMIMFRLYKRSIFDGLRFDENAIVGEDDIITPYLLHRAGRIASIDRRMYYIYERPGSLSRSGISAERWQNIAQTKVRMYQNRLRDFKNEPGYAQMVRRWYENALYDIIEAYFSCEYAEAKKILKAGFSDIYRDAREGRYLRKKQGLLFGLINIIPYTFVILQKLASKRA